MHGTDLDEHVPVPVILKQVSVQNLVLRYVASTLLVFLHELLVRVSLLRVLVQELHVRVRRRRVEIIVQLLDVLAMVALVSSHAKKTLLQDTVLAVPQREREAESLMIVGYARDTVLAPAVDSRAGVLVREMAPRVAVGRVILAYCRLFNNGTRVGPAKRLALAQGVPGIHSREGANTTHPLPVA